MYSEQLKTKLLRNEVSGFPKDYSPEEQAKDQQFKYENNYSTFKQELKHFKYLINSEGDNFGQLHKLSRHFWSTLDGLNYACSYRLTMTLLVV